MSQSLPVNTCIACNKVLDRASDPIDAFAKVNPGDVSICLYCGNIAIFKDDLTLRPPTEAELKEVTNDPFVQKILWTRYKTMKNVNS